MGVSLHTLHAFEPDPIYRTASNVKVGQIIVELGQLAPILLVLQLIEKNGSTYSVNLNISKSRSSNIKNRIRSGINTISSTNSEASQVFSTTFYLVYKLVKLMIAS